MSDWFKESMLVIYILLLQNEQDVNQTWHEVSTLYLANQMGGQQYSSDPDM